MFRYNSKITMSFLALGLGALMITSCKKDKDDDDGNNNDGGNNTGKTCMVVSEKIVRKTDSTSTTTEVKFSYKDGKIAEEESEDQKAVYKWNGSGKLEKMETFMDDTLRFYEEYKYNSGGLVEKAEMYMVNMMTSPQQFFKERGISVPKHHFKRTIASSAPFSTTEYKYNGDNMVSESTTSMSFGDFSFKSKGKFKYEGGNLVQVENLQLDTATNDFVRTSTSSFKFDDKKSPKSAWGLPAQEIRVAFDGSFQHGLGYSKNNLVEKTVTPIDGDETKVKYANSYDENYLTSAKSDDGKYESSYKYECK